MRTSSIVEGVANSSGIRLSVRKPCAMVVPKGPAAARYRVDVDPLVVAGGLGEQVDALLVDA